MNRPARILVVAIAAAFLCLPCVALAHVERTAYWPNPAPDTSVKPAAGGAVPKVRSLKSALGKDPYGGTTRVVCQPGSLARAKRNIRSARAHGYKYRPTESLRTLSAKEAKRMLKYNVALFARCKFHEIQPAVTASGNDDRVVVMPGIYTEPTSRKVPAFPPQCDKYRATSDHGSGAVTFAYQYNCPNAQSLVAVIGHKIGPGEDPQSSPTGRPDPHGIPNLGPCIRCNFQIEGSGVTPDATVIDAGRVASGNHGPIDAKKDVGIKADRADGFVARNLTVRHAAEHDVYVLETDGYLLSHMKYFYAGEYGALMFASDHGLTNTCESVGNGDSAVYPGGAPDTGARRDTKFYPQYRLNNTITHCDLHHNNLGYSGTMGNATHVIDNNFYDNTTGIATDSFFAGGHPGYPQDSSVFEDNHIYSNNFNVYAKDSDVVSAVPVPIGVGILIAGGDNDTVRNNYIYDNWRRGTMLIAVPDAISCAPNPNEGAPPCTPQGTSTVSNDDQYYGNVMSRTPDGKAIPNGVDFWWDEFPTNKGNCWHSNVGADGTAASVTSDPAPQPVAGQTLPGYLPQDCGSPQNEGIGSQRKESVLVGCVGDFATGTYDATVCDWFAPPSKPGPGGNAGQTGPNPAGVPASSLGLPAMCGVIGGEGGTESCSPFQHRLG